MKRRKREKAEDLEEEKYDEEKTQAEYHKIFFLKKERFGETSFFSKSKECKRKREKKFFFEK